MKAVIVFLLWALMATPALAAVYKCTGADGKIEFSDKPCEGTNSEPMELQYNTFEGVKSEPESAKTSKKKSARKTAATDEKSVDASEKTSSDTSKTSRKKTSSAAKTTVTTKNANERRFIREGMTAAEVRSRIGAPDSQEGGACRERTMVTSKKQLKTVRDLCEKCWIYDPAEGDPQTRTHVCFRNNEVSSVERKVVR
ncbi:MAG: DUF4124 domain-containing protein [Proteobacteria bacterium]|nr:DUF4124 domain-containing protein [Pseudomonadota bacterium]MCL2306675.1 DUF4124 domain-containing protein [Pseudomonadota bacterium]